MNKSQMANRIIHRIYEDYLMPSRLAEYERLLARLIDGGYEFHTVERFAHLVKQGQALPALSVVLRHDVDHNDRTGKMMHAIESRLGVVASYYFRLCTVDRDWMQKIDAQGSEASYHFEEIATIAKLRALADKTDVFCHLGEAQDLFCHNLAQLRKQTGLAMRVVASHGDFINRRLKTANHALLDDRLRDQLNILAEVYDDNLSRRITSRVSDCQPPQFWLPVSPDEAIACHKPLHLHSGASEALARRGTNKLSSVRSARLGRRLLQDSQTSGLIGPSHSPRIDV